MAKSSNPGQFQRKYRKVRRTIPVVRNGKQYFRVAHNEMKKHSNTEAQFRTRAVFANCINLWKSFSKDIKPIFPERPEGINNYNRFMALNLCLCHSYLPKEVLDAGGCLAHELVLSEGSLREITLEQKGDFFVSNIEIGEQKITSTTPRKEISKAIIDNNEDFHEGDLITLYILSEQEQDRNDIVIPTITLDKVCLELSLTAEDGLWGSLFMSREGEDKLCIAADAMGRCLVHSRKEENKDLASPAVMKFGHRSARYLESLTPEAFDLSAQSYGGLTE